jgi:hypothetical protein
MAVGSAALWAAGNARGVALFLGLTSVALAGAFVGVTPTEAARRVAVLLVVVAVATVLAAVLQRWDAAVGRDPGRWSMRWSRGRFAPQAAGGLVVILALAIMAFLLRAPSAGGSLADWDDDSAMLSEFKPEQVEQEWGSLQANHSVDGKPLTLQGRRFRSGLGTHAHSAVAFQLPAGEFLLKGGVGIDDEISGEAGVRFSVESEGAVLWSSGELRADTPPEFFECPVKGPTLLWLKVDPLGNNRGDHADWVELRLERRGE